MLVVAFSIAIGSVSAAKVDFYAFEFHKSGHKIGATCIVDKNDKCKIIGNTTISMMISASPKELKKYSHGRIKLDKKVVSKKLKYKDMTDFGTDTFGNKAIIKGTKSQIGKTLRFQGYDKSKKIWVNLS